MIIIFHGKEAQKDFALFKYSAVCSENQNTFWDELEIIYPPLEQIHLSLLPKKVYWNSHATTLTISHDGTCPREREMDHRTYVWGGKPFLIWWSTSKALEFKSEKRFHKWFQVLCLESHRSSTMTPANLLEEYSFTLANANNFNLDFIISIKNLVALFWMIKLWISMAYQWLYS